MINPEELSPLERKEYMAVQGSYVVGAGFSTDSERFERYFHYIRKFGKLNTNNSVLDVGCGPGPLEIYLAKYGFTNVDAIDFSDEGIKICKHHCPHFNYKVANITNLTDIYHDRKFDIVFSLQVLEHIEDHKNLLKQLYNLTNEDGLLIISVPWGKCKSNSRHINNYIPVTFINLAKKLGLPCPVVTERFGQGGIQLLVIFKKI